MKRLKLGEKALITLAKHGLLPTVNGRTDGHFLIEARQIEEFDRVYVTSSQVGVEYGVSWELLLQPEMEAHRMTFLQVDGFRTLFVLRRADVVRVLSEVEAGRRLSGQAHRIHKGEQRDMSDDEWSLLAPIMPKAVHGRTRTDDRRTINGILWYFRMGSRWSSMPARYGPRGTIRLRHQIWLKSGIWDEVVRTMRLALGDKFDPITDRRNEGRTCTGASLTDTPSVAAWNVP